jgi:hypothetical protein
MILTAYNVSQYKNAKVGEDTLFNQQIALYKLNNIRNTDPKKIFIKDLTAIVTKARKEDKDIILTGNFNELVGDDPRGMTTVLSAGNLTDVHGHQHGTVDITTYTRGIKRLDYVFVTPRLVDHLLRSGYEPLPAINADVKPNLISVLKTGRILRGKVLENFLSNVSNILPPTTESNNTFHTH